ncbi:hypothetical protein [Streptomyces sp. IB2014 016-6]|uniref:hypothetical protein n=1 Tax=Streptomyces sp. IB2014 016-6 TaxID=2517818 RepID=UPI0011C7F4B9|nr:hypothetical protein [Streptomyces sp. IB2014 016-6]TXL91779.1 hypothetical protein EW053_05635 [Streptomyces sp. IB2014 016-6]
MTDVTDDMADVTDPARARALSLQLAVNRAHSAARTGDLDLAARVLDELGELGESDEPSGPDAHCAHATVLAALNLRAKVHAQRGELTEADACWSRVEALAPDDPDAAAGRRTLAKIAAGRRHARPVVHTGRVAVVAAALAGVALIGGGGWLLATGGDDGDGDRRSSDSVAEADTGSERLREESRRADALKERLEALEAGDTAAAARRGSTLDAVAERLAMPGVEIRRHADDVQLVFSTGVFPYDSVIGPQGASALTEIGRRLADLESDLGAGAGAGSGTGVETTVVGHSVAVPGGAPSGGSVVALNRARVAAQYLAQDSDLRLTDFRLVSADQRRGPFPATEANAPRNRTVTLLITAKEPPPAP